MAARKSQQNAASDADKQKQKDVDVKLRMECARVAVQLQNQGTSIAGLTRNADTLFRYIKTGESVKRA